MEGGGQLRQHYHAGQENQLGALGLTVKVIVLWQTVYIRAVLDHLAIYWPSKSGPPAGATSPTSSSSPVSSERPVLSRPNA